MQIKKKQILKTLGKTSFFKITKPIENIKNRLGKLENI